SFSPRTCPSLYRAPRLAPFATPCIPGPPLFRAVVGRCGRLLVQGRGAGVRIFCFPNFPLIPTGILILHGTFFTNLGCQARSLPVTMILERIADAVSCGYHQRKFSC